MINTLTKNQSAYIAGLIDGDGALFITKWDKKDRPNPRYRVELSVTNTSQPIVEWLKHTLKAGRIASLNHRNAKDKQAYQWVLPHVPIKPLLEEIRPYLIVKAHKADLALAFYSNPDHKAAWNDFHTLADLPYTSEPPVISAAYAAGFIDAEGSIELHCSNGNRGRRRPEYNIGLRVVNIDPRPLAQLQRYFGVGWLIIRDNGLRRKPIWRWESKSRKTEVVLAAIQPFLVAKAERCNYCLEARQTIREGERRRHIKGHRGKTVTPPDILEKLQVLWKQVRQLNFRGIPMEGPS